MEVGFYYDVVCPWAYLASRRIEAMAARVGASVRWEPILLGGLLRALGGSDDPNRAMSPPKRQVLRRDLARTAAWHGQRLRPPSGHPRRTVDAMRLCRLAPEGPTRVAVSDALFAAYWRDGRDVSDHELVSQVASAHGLDVAALDEAPARQALFDATAAAQARGVFGVPTVVANQTVEWGQDRIGRLLGSGAEADVSPVPPGPAPAATTLRLHHDFASPFSYLGATQAEALAAGRGAALSWRPILLGAMFRDIGTPDVPLFEMSEAKRAWVYEDLRRQAAQLSVPFRFPSHFPIRTVLPLRVALVDPATTLPIYRAAWARDRRIDTPQTLGPVLADAGFDAAALLSAATTAPIKQALRDNTAAATAAGACGVPTFEIATADRTQIVWGADRLAHVDAFLGGWQPDET